MRVGPLHDADDVVSQLRSNDLVVDVDVERDADAFERERAELVLSLDLVAQGVVTQRRLAEEKVEEPVARRNHWRRRVVKTSRGREVGRGPLCRGVVLPTALRRLRLRKRSYRTSGVTLVDRVHGAVGQHAAMTVPIASARPVGAEKDDHRPLHVAPGVIRRTELRSVESVSDELHAIDAERSLPTGVPRKSDAVAILERAGLLADSHRHRRPTGCLDSEHANGLEVTSAIAAG